MSKERKEEMENNTHTSREILLMKRKRRRRKKILVFLIVLLCLSAASGAGLLLWQRSQRAARETVSITAGEGEEITYARIRTIVGNEIETALLDGDSSGEPETAGEPPDGIPDSGIPQQDSSGFGPRGADGQTGRSAYTETGKIKSWQIPVGTDVITTLGVTTTFSRLSAGDVIAVLTEADTDNILKIWIVE